MMLIPIVKPINVRLRMIERAKNHGIGPVEDDNLQQTNPAMTPNTVAMTTLLVFISMPPLGKYSHGIQYVKYHTRCDNDIRDLILIIGRRPGYHSHFEELGIDPGVSSALLSVVGIWIFFRQSFEQHWHHYASNNPVHSALLLVRAY
jgi:hypothetical protein